MRIIVALIVALVFFATPCEASGNSQLKYRIQCATTSDNLTANKFKEIPELKTFTLPSGSKIYFSGGYFNKYLNAQKRLEEVKNAGFDKAFIRVFKYSSLLSKSVGDSYIEKVKVKIQLDALNDTIATENKVVNATPTQSGKFYTRAEINKIKERAARRKAKKKGGSEGSDVKINKEKEEKIVEFDIMVKEPPVFKIFLGKYTHADGEFKEFKELKNEIVYTYQDRKETTYAVGFYKDERAALKDLSKYKNIVQGAKIVGLYKGMIISQKLANELLEQFNKNIITK